MRTLLDLAVVVPENQLLRALERADDQRLLDRRPLDALLAAHPTRAGARRLRAALGEHADQDGLSESELEARFHELCRRAKLPRPRINAWTQLPHGRWIRPDALWPDERLIVEVDSFRHHRSRGRFESDRHRDAELQELGLRVIRTTDRQLRQAADELAARLQRMLTGG